MQVMRRVVLPLHRLNGCRRVTTMMESRDVSRVFDGDIRHDWTKEEIQEVYDTPLLELMHRAGIVHRMYFNPRQVQQCTLLSIKTGGCSEDCSYCPQSSKYTTNVKSTRMMEVEEVLAAARKAKEGGSTRFCMGSAWREVGGKNTQFKKVLKMVEGINAMGMEVCTTMGMLSPEQAKQLKEAGLAAYNHNLDTSREYYSKIITTRSYDDRLNTIANVRAAGISVCSGGIIGMGEEVTDRVGLLHTLATLPEHPESVPVNALVAVDGTPLMGEEPASVWDMARMIATARVVMPGSMVRLSAGRLTFSEAEQAMLFMAGANSIFTGEKLLTTANPDFDEDQRLFKILGLEGKPSHTKPLTKPLQMVEKPAEDALVEEKAACAAA